MDAARKRNPIMHSTERLKQAEKKTLAPKVPTDAEPNGDSTRPSACDEVRTATRFLLAEGADGSHCALKRSPCFSKRVASG
jgi:hypothetical protein